MLALTLPCFKLTIVKMVEFYLSNALMLNISQCILSLSIRCDWLSSRRGGFTPVSHWIGSWVGPRASLDYVEREINLLPLPGIDPPIPQSSIP
jgi:hypothetical protein